MKKTWKVSQYQKSDEMERYLNLMDSLGYTLYLMIADNQETSIKIVHYKLVNMADEVRE